MSNRTHNAHTSWIVKTTSMFVPAALLLTFASSCDRSCSGQTSCRPRPVAEFDAPSMASYRGEYVNSVYEYSVSIPDALIGHGSPSPAPQHGFGILLGPKGEGYLWVDGSWNSFDHKSSQDFARDISTFLQKRGAVVTSRRIRTWMLSGIDATRVTLHYRCPDSKEEFVNEAVTALSPDRSRVWEICLDTSLKMYAEHLGIYETILKSWRYRSGRLSK